MGSLFSRDRVSKKGQTAKKGQVLTSSSSPKPASGVVPGASTPPREASAPRAASAQGKLETYKSSPVVQKDSSSSSSTPTKEVVGNDNLINSLSPVGEGASSEPVVATAATTATTAGSADVGAGAAADNASTATSAATAATSGDDTQKATAADAADAAASAAAGGDKDKDKGGKDEEGGVKQDFSHYNNKLTIGDFELLKVLGKGSFGKVMLVRKYGNGNGNGNGNKSNSSSSSSSSSGSSSSSSTREGEEETLYALKTLRKATLIARNQLAHTSTERLVLQEIYSPFLVHLVYAFQTPDKLYMVLDYVGGGELFFWLKKEKRFNENRCRLYAAEIALALDAMQKENIVYRDLKPENVLLDAAGHVKLTDFGLAKGGVYTADGERGTKTFCGTPEYLAPEIIENKGHGLAVDWWALGTLLYEMLLGLPPFYDQNIHKMYTKILHDPLRFPKREDRQISDRAKAVLRRFLERKVLQRMGSDGINEEMQNCAFFADQDFEAVFNHEIVPEFAPPVSANATDVSNFDEEFTREVPQDSVVTNKMTTSMQNKSAFAGFTYTEGKAGAEEKAKKGKGGGKGRGDTKIVKESGAGTPTKKQQEQVLPVPPGQENKGGDKPTPLSPVTESPVKASQPAVDR